MSDPTPSPSSTPPDPDGMAAGKSALKWVHGLAGATGALIPGFAWFSSYSPPLFKAATLLTGGGAAAVLILGFSSKGMRAALLRRGVRCVLFALGLIVSYGVLFEFTTLVDLNAEPVRRIQIGFGTAEWSLTPAALEILDHPDVKRQPDKLAHAFGIFGGVSAPSVAWKQWAIYLASVLLTLLFASGFLLWSYGFAVLARGTSLQPEVSKP